MRRVLLSAALAAFTPVASYAQTCVGYPALATSSGNVAMGASFFDGGKTYAGGLTLGGPVFGHASFGYTDFDDTTLSLKAISAGIGYDLTQQGGASICPALSGAYGFGLEIFGVDVTVLELSPSVSIGYAAELSPTIDVVPSGSAAFIYSRLNADAGPLGEESETETSGLLGLGISLVFNDRFSIGPRVVVPVGQDDGDTAFGVSMAVAVGGR